MKRRSLFLAAAILPAALMMTGCSLNLDELFNLSSESHDNTPSSVAQVTEEATEVATTGETEVETEVPTSETETESVAPAELYIPEVPASLTLDKTFVNNGYVYQQEPYMVVGNTMYFHHYTADSIATSYASCFQSYADSCPGLTVYGLVAPASSIAMSDDLQAQYGESAQIDHLHTYCAALNGTSTRAIEIAPILSQHRGEYLYFQADTHWTQLSAYYAYAQFCIMKGQQPSALTDYECVVGTGFKSAHYDEMGGAAVFGEEGDTIRAYLPKSSNSTLTITEQTGSTYTSPVIVTSNISNYTSFIAGDHYFSVITNPDKNDGSACLVIKDSYGNPFITFLTDDYNYVYIVDYRLYDQGLVSLIKEKGITDMVVVNGVNMTSNVVEFLNGRLY